MKPLFKGAIVLLGCIFAFSCASYKPLVKKDFESLAPLTLVYPKTNPQYIIEKSTDHRRGRIISEVS